MLMLILLAACTASPAASGPIASVEPPPAAPIEAPSPADTVGTAFPPPPGFTRVDTDAFGASLLDLRVLAADRPVLTYDGREVAHHARVIDLPMVPGDLQQCADAAIRVRAEWLKANDKEISFHATSGDPMPWARYQAGDRAYAPGNDLLWKSGKGPATWDQYLSAVFTWAGTRSLVYDTVAATAPRAGELVVSPGSPGHAVVLLDVATDGSRTVVLIGEGYMPAQQFHVELGDEAGWLAWDDGIDVPSWGKLPASGLRAWKD
jgi:hypothetical protein